MSRHYWSKKDSADDYDDIDVFWLKNHGYFCGRKCGGIRWTNHWGKDSSVSFCVSVMDEKYVQFTYASTNKETGKKTDYDYKVQLVSTPCNLGGVRYWFVCPLIINNRPCGRRVGKLFLGKYFGCRHCYNLTYDSRNTPRHGMYGYLGRFYKYERDLELLYAKTKIKYRKGKPTRNYRKILALSEVTTKNAAAVIQATNQVLGKP